MLDVMEGRLREAQPASGDRSRRGARVVLQVTMAAGLERVVRAALEHDIAGIEIVREESAMLTLTAPAGRLPTLSTVPYASVVLLELGSVRARSLDVAVERLAEQLLGQAMPAGFDTRRGYRIRVSDAGALVKISPRSKAALEQAASRWAGLRPDPRGGGMELWVRRRRDADTITLSLRVDRLPTDKPAAGELKRDVAAALVRVVEPAADETFLDPFAGSGAIPKARAAYDAAGIVAADRDPKLASGLDRLRRSGLLGGAARTGRVDVSDVEALRRLVGGGQVDTVVTDPPWGLYEGGVREVEFLYQAAVRSLAALMGGSGRMVLLTAATDEAVGALAGSPFELEHHFPVLVNGKKASVLQALGHG